jgi:hypothetical protein
LSIGEGHFENVVPDIMNSLTEVNESAGELPFVHLRSLKIESVIATIAGEPKPRTTVFPWVQPEKSEKVHLVITIVEPHPVRSRNPVVNDESPGNSHVSEA